MCMVGVVTSHQDQAIAMRHSGVLCGLGSLMCSGVQALCVYTTTPLLTSCTCVLVYLCTCVLLCTCGSLLGALKRHPTPSMCSIACLLPHAMSSGYWLERVEHGVLCGLPHVPRASHTLCVYHSLHVLRRSALDLVYLCTCLKYLATPSGIYIIYSYGCAPTGCL